jgi:hypothetical protein
MRTAGFKRHGRQKARRGGECFLSVHNSRPLLRWRLEHDQSLKSRVLGGRQTTPREQVLRNLRSPEQGGGRIEGNRRHHCRLSKVWRMSARLKIQSHDEGGCDRHIDPVDPTAEKTTALQEIKTRPAMAGGYDVLTHGTLRPPEVEAAPIHGLLDGKLPIVLLIVSEFPAAIQSTSPGETCDRRTRCACTQCSLHTDRRGRPDHGLPVTL